MASRCAASRTARPDPGRQKRKLAPIKHLPPDALTFTSAFAPVPPYSNLHFKCRRPPLQITPRTGTETHRPRHHQPTNSSLSLSLPSSSSLVSSHFVLRTRRMRCHRIPREYILAAKIKVPARMSYGDPVRVPSAIPKACPRALLDDFIVLHTFRSSAFPCGDIGPVCSSSDSFCFRGNELWRLFSHPLESWFMDRLGLSFMARLGILICIFECVFVTSRESTIEDNYESQHFAEYKKMY